jgi:hypothetical protein
MSRVILSPFGSETDAISEDAEIDWPSRRDTLETAVTEGATIEGMLNPRASSCSLSTSVRYWSVLSV